MSNLAERLLLRVRDRMLSSLPLVSSPPYGYKTQPKLTPSDTQTVRIREGRQKTCFSERNCLTQLVQF